LLNNISSPADIRSFSDEELNDLCREIRERFIDIISESGGHFAAGLGVVELTVAIHYLFNTPVDQLIWDVGHQAYAHKMITGRLKDLPNIRKYGGISGFPKRDENEYDAFGTGHASTSISAALGMAVAAQLSGDYQKQHIAVIGDGALTGGLAFEGLNNAGVSSANLIIILNDNSISIDPAVGALSQNLEHFNEAGLSNKTRGIADGRTKRPKTSAYWKDKGMKATNISPRHFFESLNIPYHGPVDGNNLNELLNALRELKSMKGPRMLHIKTVKGKGYPPAEENQVTWHAPGKFDKLTGIRKSNPKSTTARYQEVFGQSLCELAEGNQKIVGITPAMPSGSSLNLFMDAFPDRAFDVGIAEEHAVTFSAGLATQGFIPYCNIYSTFLQRAYDQVIHDVCLQKLPVVFCLDRAGIVGEDGPTHHGVFDLSLLRTIPNIIISAPRNGSQLRNLLYTAQLGLDLPIAIRYPRGKVPDENWYGEFEKTDIGKAEVIKKGNNLAVLALGNRVLPALKVIEANNLDVTLVDMQFLKPLDTECLLSLVMHHTHFLTIEDGALNGGLGSAVLEFFSENSIKANVLRLGLPDEFIEHGSPADLYAQYNLDENGILRAIKNLIK